MKAFERNQLNNFRYPEEMAKILDYLGKHGTLNISPEEVERLYEDYSEQEWCASWIIVNDARLSDFAEFLENIEI